MNISIRQGHVIDELKKIPDNSVDCITTSSPYYGLREYGASDVIWDGGEGCDHEWITNVKQMHNGRGDSQKSGKYSDQDPVPDFDVQSSFCKNCNAWKGELGQEPSYKMFVKHLLDVAKELRRVLKPTGTMFWNINDSYSGSGGWKGKNEESEEYVSNVHLGEGAYPRKPPSKDKDIPRKSQFMIPERFAIGLIDQGWVKRNTLVWYKCLSGNTQLYVKNNGRVFRTTIKDMAKIKNLADMYVYGKDWRKVIRIEKQQTTDLLTLHLRNGMHIEATPEHRFILEDGNLKESSSLKVGNKLAHTRFPDSLGTELGTEEIGFVIGLYIAEGSKMTSERKKKNGIQFALHKKEQYLADKVINFSKKFNGMCSTYVYNNNLAVHLWGKIPMAIIDHYVVGYGAKLKHLSNEAWMENNMFLEGVLQGYLEGDGHYDIMNNRWRIGFALNRQLEYDLRLICNRLGYNMRSKRGYVPLNGRIFPVIRGEIRMEKTGHFNEKHDYEILRIVKTKGITYDIEVDGDHLFALIDGTLTHNSNGMPSSTMDRFSNKWEPIFFFTKNPDYWFDLDPVRKPYEQSSIKRIMQPHIENQVQTGKVADFDSENMNIKHIITNMSNKAKRDWFDKNNPHIMRKHASDYGVMNPDRPMDLSNANGANPGDLMDIPTRSHSFAHFAVYPETLIEPLIQSGCAREVCSKCGKPKMPFRVKTGRRYDSRTGEYSEDERVGSRKVAEANNNSLSSVFNTDLIYETVTVWKPSCKCNVPFISGTVLDPFAGSGTTAVVAKKLGLSAICIELGPSYVDIMRKRLEMDKGETDADFQEVQKIDDIEVDE